MNAAGTWKTYVLYLVSSFGLLSFTCERAFAVTWDEQAGRLQLVSASLLDAQPLLSSISTSQSKISGRIEAKAIITVLPKMNATVGGKREQPPQPPAHAIPTIEGALISPKLQYGNSIARAWAGHLPESAASNVGMKAVCEQSIGGLSLGISTDLPSGVGIQGDLGYQWNQSEVKGGITEAEASDLFIVKTQLRFAALTLRPGLIQNAWIQAQILERSVSTHFEIPSDGTSFDRDDSSTIASGSAATQFSVGYSTPMGIQAAVAFLNTPQRVTMPRILLSFSRQLGSTPQNIVQN